MTSTLLIAGTASRACALAATRRQSQRLAVAFALTATWAVLPETRNGRLGIEVDPQDGQRLWVSRVTWGEGARGGVFGSRDGGQTWHELTGNLPYVKPLILRYGATTHDLWAGGVGLFRTRQ